MAGDKKCVAITRTCPPGDLSIDFCGCVAGEIPYTKSEWPVRESAWPYEFRFYLCLFILSVPALQRHVTWISK